MLPIVVGVVSEETTSLLVDEVDAANPALVEVRLLTVEMARLSVMLLLTVALLPVAVMLLVAVLLLVDTILPVVEALAVLLPLIVETAGLDEWLPFEG